MPSVLILGGGGREHALAWRLAQSKHVNTVFVAPGNGAPFPNADVSMDDADEIVDFCEENDVSLVIVGPEAPLSKGIVDKINGRVPVFGPTENGAMLETSKIFAKQFMNEFDLLTAGFAQFEDVQDAIDFINSCTWSGIVVKADGLAAGKGVVVTENKEQAEKAARAMLQGEFGESSRRIILEEKLEGYEISALCFTDGVNFSRMPLIRDHKRLLENDLGPNTGGMGVVGPVKTPGDVDKKIDEILQKTIAGLMKRGIQYKGVIYAGFMITPTGPSLLEFNCRFGDPETEILMRLLRSDLYDVCVSCVEGTLSKMSIDWDSRHACGVVLASKNYPAKGDKGTPIKNVPADTDDVVVFHAGTTEINSRLVTNGGRIMCVTAVADSPAGAREKAVAACEAIQFEGKFYRQDIGRKFEESVRPSLSYGDSGVDINEGNAFVEGIKDLVKSTLKPGMGQIGGFGAVIDFQKAGFGPNAQIVVGIDGVGTKIELADAIKDYSGIGHDVVGMCVNDVLCHGAAPIAFLDYFVCGRLDRNMATQVVASIAEACKEAGCSLVGGETAEMPGVYGIDQWDLAGCAIAARDADWPMLPQTHSMCAGDLVIGLPSSGVHSNGFSLVRKIFAINGVKYTQPAPWDPTKTIGRVLLAPTRLYVRQLISLLKENKIKACAHITGGGIEENAIRVLERKGDLALEIDANSWEKQPLFNWLAGMGPVTNEEMLRTFNCGIGMVLMVDKKNQDEVIQRLKDFNEQPTIIGKVGDRKGEKLISFTNLANSFDRSQWCAVQRRKIKVGILISGNGSNMMRLIERTQRPGSNCEVVMVISNKPDAKGLEKARSLGIPTRVVPHTPVREEGDRVISKVLSECGVEMICLGGYMRLLSPEFVQNWPNKVINIHPSLLPAFKGAHAVRDTLTFGAKVTGCTVHFVDEELDHGPIIDQSPILVEDGETELTLHQKIQKKEHDLFPVAMEKLAAQMLKIHM